jgi:hypothetical protein
MKRKQPSTDQNVPGENMATDEFGEAPKLPSGSTNPDRGNKGGEGPMGRTTSTHPEANESQQVPGLR